MNDRFLKACRGDQVSATPVWFMRQAGRYMAPYRALREKHSLLELATTPELAVEVTLQPVNRFAVDAAILFADILLPLKPMNCPFSFQKGEGPVIEKPIRTPKDIQDLRTFDAEEDLSYVCEAVRLLSQELRDRIPLIGFAGGPFTLASYMIEGGKSRDFRHSKGLMAQNPKAWHALMEKISKVTISYLGAQIGAGAQAIQLFDSWIGCLSPEDYAEYVFPYSREIFREIGQRFPEIPRIHFGTGTSMLLSLMFDAGATVIGLDWQTPFSFARKTLGQEVPLQGNLDPVALFSPPAVLEKRVKRIMEENRNKKGHIFNLGHGILPETPVESVEQVIEIVHTFR